MSILETFYILFKTDADEAAKDIKKVDDASDNAEKSVENLEKAFRAAKIRAEELAIAAEKARLSGSANAKDLATQAALARVNARELGLELQKIDKSAKTAAVSLGQMAGKLVGPVLAFLTSGAALAVATQRAAAVRELDQFSSKLNSSISDVDAFQRAVKGMGGETAAALDTLVKLGEKVNEAFSDAESGARKDFTEWGLAFKNAEGGALGASDAMLELAGNLENVSRAEALARIKKLGIEDAASIDLLLRGRAALEQRIRAEKELGVVTEGQAASIREYYGELGRAQNALTSIGNAILTALLPAMTKAVEMFGNLAEWVGRNKTLVVGFFIGVAGVITAMYLPAITAAAAATLAATWPFLAIAAAIAAVGVIVALVYEDIMAFLNGQPSLIGALAERYQIVADVIKFIGQQFENTKQAGIALIEALKTGWATFVSASESASEATRAFWSSVQPIWTALKDLVGAVVEFVGRLSDAIGDDLAPGLARMGETFATIKQTAVDLFEAIFGDIDQIGAKAEAAAATFSRVFTAAFNGIKLAWDYTVGAILSGIENLTSWLNSISFNSPLVSTPANDNAAAAGASIGAMMGRGQALAAGASGAAINTATPGAVNTVNTSNVTVGNVTVNTQATDARAVAGAVRGELQKQLRGTAAQFDDGVDR